jgi:hypothetical protein
VTALDDSPAGELAASIAAELKDFLADVLERVQTADRIPFGPNPSDDMPADWASRGLIWLHGTYPVVFARMMMAITGIDPDLLVAPQRSHKAKGAGNGTDS